MHDNPVYRVLDVPTHLAAKQPKTENACSANFFRNGTGAASVLLSHYLRFG